MKYGKIRNGLSRAAITVCLAAAVTITGCTQYSPEMKATLKKAGGNSSQLEAVLAHYQETGETQKLAAARFLIENMADHCFVQMAMFDKDGKEIDYDPLKYANFDEAHAALDELGKQHEGLDYKTKSITRDVEVITADYLIENIDLAFEAWKSKPWCKDLSFEAFCEHILPYRCSNEPVTRWRKACMERYADLPSKMENPADAAAVAKLIEADVHKWVGFDSIYYLHPTDQGFDEMCRMGKGRCEDISNMISYAMRANCVAVASDYTPAWANRDNNHAWNAVLNPDGTGDAPLCNVAAKVYRKTFSIQKDAFWFQKKDGEQIPGWLRSKNFIDVTDQYKETTDVAVKLVKDVPEKSTFAYLHVFNGGRWAAIAGGKIDGRTADFQRMGRGIIYMPGYFADGKTIYAAPAFTIDKTGKINVLDGSDDDGRTFTVEITTTKPEITDDDTKKKFATMVVEKGKAYELLEWDYEWKNIAETVGSDKPVKFENLHSDRLYWLVEKDGKKLERPFTIEAGRQIWW